jgi:hypothetical protein
MFFFPRDLIPISDIPIIEETQEEEISTRLPDLCTLSENIAACGSKEAAQQPLQQQADPTKLIPLEVDNNDDLAPFDSFITVVDSDSSSESLCTWVENTTAIKIALQQTTIQTKTTLLTHESRTTKSAKRTIHEVETSPERDVVEIKSTLEQTHDTLKNLIQAVDKIRLTDNEQKVYEVGNSSEQKAFEIESNQNQTLEDDLLTNLKPMIHEIIFDDEELINAAAATAKNNRKVDKLINTEPPKPNQMKKCDVEKPLKIPKPQKPKDSEIIEYDRKRQMAFEETFCLTTKNKILEPNVIEFTDLKFREWPKSKNIKARLITVIEAPNICYFCEDKKIIEDFYNYANCEIDLYYASVKETIKSYLPK